MSQVPYFYLLNSLLGKEIRRKKIRAYSRRNKNTGLACMPRCPPFVAAGDGQLEEKLLPFSKFGKRIGSWWWEAAGWQEVRGWQSLAHHPLVQNWWAMYLCDMSDFTGSYFLQTACSMSFPKSKPA